MSEKEMGKSIAAFRRASQETDRAGRFVGKLEYEVALAPYDLGVTQELFLTTQYDPHVRSYRLHLSLHRLSGLDTNWMTTNRPFLETIRKRLMAWRNLELTQQQWHGMQAKQIFGFMEERESETGGGAG